MPGCILPSSIPLFLSLPLSQIDMYPFFILINYLPLSIPNRGFD